MGEDKFEQPIFGANYMRGTVKPMYGLIPGPAKYKFWFMNGGCSKFLKCYHYVVDKLRAEMRKQTFNQGYAPQFGSGNFQEQFVAFADANDPSTLYVSQPPVAPQPQPMQSYMGGYTGPTYVPGAVGNPQPAYQPPPGAVPSYQSDAPPAYQPPPSGAPGYPSMPPNYQPGYQPGPPVYQPGPPNYQPGYQPNPPTYQPGPSFPGNAVPAYGAPYQPGPPGYQPRGPS